MCSIKKRENYLTLVFQETDVLGSSPWKLSAQRQRFLCAMTDWCGGRGTQAFSSLSPNTSPIWPFWPTYFGSRKSNAFQWFPGVQWEKKIFFWCLGVVTPQCSPFFWNTQRNKQNKAMYFRHNWTTLFFRASTSVGSICFWMWSL